MPSSSRRTDNVARAHREEGTAATSDEPRPPTTRAAHREEGRSLSPESEEGVDSSDPEPARPPTPDPPVPVQERQSRPDPQRQPNRVTIVSEHTAAVVVPASIYYVRDNVTGTRTGPYANRDGYLIPVLPTGTQVAPPENQGRSIQRGAQGRRTHTDGPRNQPVASRDQAKPPPQANAAHPVPRGPVNFCVPMPMRRPPSPPPPPPRYTPRAASQPAQAPAPSAAEEGRPSAAPSFLMPMLHRIENQLVFLSSEVRQLRAESNRAMSSSNESARLPAQSAEPRPGSHMTMMEVQERMSALIVQNRQLRAEVQSARAQHRMSGRESDENDENVQPRQDMEGNRRKRRMTDATNRK